MAPSAAQPLTWPLLLAHPQVTSLLQLALAEDVGEGDVTTQSIFPNPQRASTSIVARQPTVACGWPLAATIFHHFDPTMHTHEAASEGADVGPGDVIARIEGDVRAILTAERCALNFLMRLCGIAFGTRQVVRQLPKDSAAALLDTRKTTPGWRLLEKMAVRTGGGHNHRMGLYDGVLIKDNHIAKCGSVKAAVEQARAHVGDSMPVEVEIDHLEQLDQALSAGADIILLDNFTPEHMREAVQRTQGRALLEASGGITVESIAQVAATGVDRISMGALTHTVLPADLSLEMEICA